MGPVGWGPVRSGYLRPNQFLDHLTVIIIRKRADMLLHIVDSGRGRKVWTFGVQDLVAWDKPRWKATAGKNI